MPTAAEVFREFNVDGDAGSGQYQPEKTEIIEWGEGLETGIAALETKDTEHDGEIAALDTAVGAMVQTVIDALYPVGALLFTSSSSVPSAYATGRTWVPHAQGRAIVGVGTADGVAYTGGQERGAATHQLSTSELPSHNHSRGSLAVAIGNGGNDWRFDAASFVNETPLLQNLVNISESDGSNESYYIERNFVSTRRRRFTHNATHNHSASVSGATGSIGNGVAHNNIQPSIGVYVFRRTE